MKDMEIKTENRYEYRKTQEKRKQMIAPDYLNLHMYRIGTDI